MNAHEILTLVNAGFNKAEIMSLMGDTAEKTENGPAEAAKADKDINTQPAAENPAESVTEPQTALPPELAAALENINATLAKLQTFAVKTDAQPQPAANDYKTILGSIINNKKE